VSTMDKDDDPAIALMARFGKFFTSCACEGVQA
jgi:hypothetical protein